jgi:hypothetical protein
LPFYVNLEFYVLQYYTAALEKLIGPSNFVDPFDPESIDSFDPGSIDPLLCMVNNFAMN